MTVPLAPSSAPSGATSRLKSASVLVSSSTVRSPDGLGGAAAGRAAGAAGWGALAGRLRGQRARGSRRRTSGSRHDGHRRPAADLEPRTEGNAVDDARPAGTALVDRRLGRARGDGALQLALGSPWPPPVRAPTSSSGLRRAPAWADVSTALLARVLPADRTARCRPAGSGWRPRRCSGVPPLVQGALLVVDAPTTPAAMPGLVELRVVCGPGAGGVHRLAPGSVLVGTRPLERGAAGGPRREPGALPPHPSPVPAPPWPTWTPPTAPAWTAARRARGRALPYGAVLRLGATSLVLAGPRGPAAPLEPPGTAAGRSTARRGCARSPSG
jgi:hypothetical protein